MRLGGYLLSPLMGRSIRSVGGYVDVRLFLESIGCGDAAANFNRIEELLEVKPLDLRKKGIPPKQRKRILRHLEFLRHGIVPYEYAVKYHEQQKQTETPVENNPTAS
ncbi:hypothetical protein GAYE_PCTG52G1264 [Galdieria yellowstonensis]|uniref:Small ribosomal subunit protein mS41 SAM domain-containing protein n=1 Tax=Galdieria yellowstonensis TaxID=3028027 RepID=A0AAV9I808_9RHOD|nr:hypothetical protein GAYE_PCTG52G1264 [Galdieria yellowstonensis]